MSSFSYNPNILTKLEKALSAKRLHRYILLSSGNIEEAIKLHLWNAALGASFYVPLQNFELVFRNALNDQLTASFGNDWYDALYPHFHSIFQRQIHAAKDELVKQGRIPIQSSAVITQFTFGSWVNLVHHRYDRVLWKFCLYDAFPNHPPKFTRKLVKDSLEQIRNLRNRIAHHEFISDRALDEDFRLMITVASWICPITSDWIERHNQFVEVWRQKPTGY